MLLVACTKYDEPDYSSPSYYESHISVREYVTNIPIAGAKVTLLKCNQLDIEFGCINGYTPVGTFITDSSGKAAYNNGIRWYYVEVSRDGYWRERSRHSWVILNPVCYLKVRLVKNSTLSPDMMVYVAAIRSPGLSGFYYNYKNVGQPLDTTFYLRGTGNTETAVWWYIKAKDSSDRNVQVQKTAPTYIHRFDTAQVTVIY